MTRDIYKIARILGGSVSRGEVLFPAPGHSPRDRSASLRFIPSAPDGFLVHSFAGDDPLALRNYVRRLLGVTADARFQHSPSHQTSPRITSAIKDAERTARALSIWNQGVHPYGTPVEPYLGRRGLALPAAAAGEAVRFHPDCPFSGQRTPSMVCLIRDTLTNEPKAIHRTALTWEGTKVEINGNDRLTYGPLAGGAIKFTPDADVTICLGIGEGVESTLSLQNVPEFGPSPIWSLVFASGIAGLPILAGIESLWIAVDHDEAGIRASRSTARRWQDAGSEVILAMPRAPRDDLNDLLRAGYA